jgi:hypothetical protein
MAGHPILDRPRRSSGHRLNRQLRDSGRAAMYLLSGAFIGMGAFVVVDSFGPPEEPSALGALSFREPYYASCREAFQDGRANIRRGEPGYRTPLDADDDGLACEPYGRSR